MAAAGAAARASSMAATATTLPLPTTAAQARNDPRAVPVAAMASFGGMMMGYIMHSVLFSIKESEFDNVPGAAHHLVSSAFWLAHGSRMAVIIPMLLPIGAIYWLAFPNKKSDPKLQMHATVELRTRFRYALRVQGAGNLLGCVVLKLFADEWHIINSVQPIQRTNGTWIVVSMCASLMCTFGIFCLQLSRQKRALRWMLVVPLVQCVWNLTHDFEWLLGFYTGPAEDMAGFGLLHGIFAGPVFLVQLHHFWTAEATAPSAEAGESVAAEADSPVFVRKRAPGAGGGGDGGYRNGGAHGLGGDARGVGADAAAAAASLSRQMTQGANSLLSRAAAAGAGATGVSAPKAGSGQQASSAASKSPSAAGGGAAGGGGSAKLTHGAPPAAPPSAAPANGGVSRTAGGSGSMSSRGGGVQMV